MRKALIIIGAFIALALLLTLVGALLPVAHTARVRITLTQPAPPVYDAIADVARYQEWRTGLDSLRVVDAGPPLRWRESSSMGTIEFVQLNALPPRTVQAEIQGAKEQGFGGTWTWDLVPRAEGGTTLVITEHGAVYNPIFRLLSRFFFSPYTTLEQYARDLAARLGESAVPERLTP